MNKELLTIALAFGCIASNATTNNYDLLGRKGSKMNTPMVYRNVDYSKAKKNEQQKLGASLAKQGVGLTGDAKAIIGWSSPKGYGFKKCTSGTGCASFFTPIVSKTNISDYLDKANEVFIPVYSDNLPKYNDTYNYQSAGVTRSNYSGFQLGEAPYDMPLDEFQSHASYGTINSLLNRNYRANSNVGLYLSEDAVPVRLNQYTDPNPNAPIIIDERNEVMETFNTMPGAEMRASKMYKLVHSFSDRSVVYVTRNRPSNPASNSHGPQAYIGVHGYGGSDKTAYNSLARDLDNYIYNNRTIEIVAAGNNPKKMSAKGYAVNAITVGALDPLTGKEASYSGKSGKIVNPLWYDEYAKPDIYNYSNFYIDDFYRVYSSSSRKYEYKPFYEGTEAATGVTAGMVSDMLSKNEFYKWHPEVVKAVMLNTKNAGMLNYEGLVGKTLSSQKDREYQHLSMYFVGGVNTLMKEAKCEALHEDCHGIISFEGKKALTLKISRTAFNEFFDVDRDFLDGFRIAISWLNSGNDIANLGDVPQKYKIFVYTRNVDNSYYILRSWSDDDRYENFNHSGYPSYPYNYHQDYGYSPRHFTNLADFLIQIVLDEENPSSENYGQMALGVDIMPIVL